MKKKESDLTNHDKGDLDRLEEFKARDGLKAVKAYADDFLKAKKVNEFLDDEYQEENPEWYKTVQDSGGWKKFAAAALKVRVLRLRWRRLRL